MYISVEIRLGKKNAQPGAIQIKANLDKIKGEEILSGQNDPYRSKYLVWRHLCINTYGQRLWSQNDLEENNNSTIYKVTFGKLLRFLLIGFIMCKKETLRVSAVQVSCENHMLKLVNINLQMGKPNQFS